jgi:hypothetical protein
MENVNQNSDSTVNSIWTFIKSLPYRFWMFILKIADIFAWILPKTILLLIGGYFKEGLNKFINLCNTAFNVTKNEATAPADTFSIWVAIICALITAITFLILLIYNNVENFVKYSSTIIVAIFVVITAFVLAFNIYLNANVGKSANTNVNSSGPSLRVVGVSMFAVIAICAILFIYIYLNRISKLVDEMSMYPILLMAIAVSVLMVLSYNRYVFNEYSGLLVVCLLLFGFIIYKNPFEVISKYTGPSAFAMIMIIALITLLMFNFQNEKMSTSGSESNNTTTKTISETIKYFLIACILSAVIYLGSTFQSGFMSGSGTSSKYIFFAILLVGLAIVYKIILASGFLNDHPAIRFFVNLIFYIPCILVDISDYIIRIVFQTYNTTSKSMWLLLLVESVLLFFYFLYPVLKYKFYQYIFIDGKNDATLLINKPRPLTSEYIVGSYKNLNCGKQPTSTPDDPVTTTSSDGTKTTITPNDDGTITTKVETADGKTKTITGYPTCEYNYNYAFSLWFNIDASFPSSVFKTILNYGEKPHVKYQGTTNTIMITVHEDDDADKNNTNYSERTTLIKQMKKDGYSEAQIGQKLKELGIEVDASNNLIVYKNSKVLLQRWNNLVINYNGGTLDIFLNGELVRSSVNVAPFMTYDNLVIGETNGFSGGISSLIHYKHPLNILEVHNIYDTFKDANPPVFPDNSNLFNNMN